MNILLIADDSKFVEVLKKGLEEFGFNVQTTKHTDAENSIDLKNAFDLIIVDEVADSVGTEPDYNNTFLNDRNSGSVLVLTERNLNITGNNSKRIRTDYLSKPFEFKHLLTYIVTLRNEQYRRLDDRGNNSLE